MLSFSSTEESHAVCAAPRPTKPTKIDVKDRNSVQTFIACLVIDLRIEMFHDLLSSASLGEASPPQVSASFLMQ